MRFFFIVLIYSFTVACSPTISMDDSSLLMSDKLQYTKWRSIGFTKKQYVEISSSQIKLHVGKLLGSAYTPFTIVDEDNHYVLYNIYEDYLLSHLGIVQIDERTVKILIWQSNVLPQKQEIVELINKKGKSFKLIKKKSKFALFFD